jgi:hypothetical protein
MLNPPKKIIYNYAFINLQPYPLNWAATLSHLSGMMELTGTPLFPEQGLGAG